MGPGGFDMGSPAGPVDLSCVLAPLWPWAIQRLMWTHMVVAGAGLGPGEARVRVSVEAACPRGWPLACHVQWGGPET